MMDANEAIGVLRAERESIVVCRDASPRIDDGREKYWQERIDALNVAIRALEERAAPKSEGGDDRDDEITHPLPPRNALKNLREYLEQQQTGCPYIRTTDEGTSYCDLAAGNDRNFDALVNALEESNKFLKVYLEHSNDLPRTATIRRLKANRALLSRIRGNDNA